MDWERGGMATDRNEAAVELEVLYPLLTQPGQLAIPADAIKPKQYLPPTQLDKSGGKTFGYYPDFSVWLFGCPVAVVEAKDPAVTSETGFREACLYARHLNSRYPTGLNPCRFVLASNGISLLAGYWDQDKPVLELKVEDLGVGTKALDDLISFCGDNVLQTHAHDFSAKSKRSRGVRPFNLVGGQPLLASKKPLNSFAADLSPVLRRYFSSTNQDNIREIAERAYVSSAETTEYDRVLEALLKDRVSPRRDTIVEPIRTTKSGEPLLTKALNEYSESDSRSGQLQIVQGGVGSGKSLFARRYRELLQPDELKQANYWAFIDFGSSPASLQGAEEWLCKEFIKSFERENSLDIYDGNTLKGIFSRKIQQRRAYYEALRGLKNSNDDEVRARASDIATWQDNPFEFAEGIAHYAISTKKNLIVVMDNVDKLDLTNQLLAFQLSLWFMEKTRAFTILQMRDETYERYKNKKPLDTFRAGIAFHIAPPRFIDVIKRRLELGVEYLAAHAAEKQEYTLDNGVRVVLPKGELGNFLHSLYGLLFGQRTNVARVLEALSGRDVRKALEMFVSIVTSGHLSTSALTSAVKGEGQIPITEYHILRILMRTDYRFFSDASGYVSNLFYYDNDWAQPDNFLLIEILYFLAMNRKRVGEIGLEGYYSTRRVCDEVQRIGYDWNDVLKAQNYLLGRQLIIADNFNNVEVTLDDSVKITASGFIHLRVLCERIEYLSGVLPVVPISDDRTSVWIGEQINRESQRGFSTLAEKTRSVETLVTFLKYELAKREKNPFFDRAKSGAGYVVDAMERTVRRYYKLDAILQSDKNQLDLI
jgi:hypothetical protein